MKKASEECRKKAMTYEKQSRDIQKAKDSLYERYAEGKMHAGEYRKRADELEEERKWLMCLLKGWWPIRIRGWKLSGILRSSVRFSIDFREAKNRKLVKSGFA